MKKKSWIIILSLIALFIIVTLIFKLSLINQPQKDAPTLFQGSAIRINYNNLELMLSKNELIKSLPTSGLVLLKFYGLREGKKIFERSYVIKKSSVKEGSTEKADIILELDSKYLNELTDQNLCSIIKAAQKNGDFSSDITISMTSLLWKYRGMLKNHDCLGI